MSSFRLLGSIAASIAWESEKLNETKRRYEREWVRREVVCVKGGEGGRETVESREFDQLDFVQAHAVVCAGVFARG